MSSLHIILLNAVTRYTAATVTGVTQTKLHETNHCSLNITLKQPAVEFLFFTRIQMRQNIRPSRSLLSYSLKSVLAHLHET